MNDYMFHDMYQINRQSHDVNKKVNKIKEDIEDIIDYYTDCCKEYGTEAFAETFEESCKKEKFFHKDVNIARLEDILNAINDINERYGM